MEENKTMTISKLKNHYGGHMQTAITQKDLEYLSKTLHTAYTYVHKQCAKISCNLEMVTRKSFVHLAHFKWNYPIANSVQFMAFIPLTPTVAILDGYSYKASCVRPG